MTTTGRYICAVCGQYLTYMLTGRDGKWSKVPESAIRDPRCGYCGGLMYFDESLREREKVVDLTAIRARRAARVVR